MPVATDTFRTIAACFPTGVTIVTARDTDGSLRGLTSNAFSSVSVDPPLVLVCLDQGSNTLSAIQRSGAFVVNFLAAAEAALSDRFASKGDDKFAALAYQPSVVAAGAPILADRVVGHAECLVHAEVPLGDHIAVVGRVEAGEAIPNAAPLMYFRRTYAPWPATS